MRPIPRANLPFEALVFASSGGSQWWFWLWRRTSQQPHCCLHYPLLYCRVHAWLKRATRQNLSSRRRGALPPVIDGQQQPRRRLEPLTLFLISSLDAAPFLALALNRTDDYAVQACRLPLSRDALHNAPDPDLQRSWFWPRELPGYWVCSTVYGVIAAICGTLSFSLQVS